VSTCCVSSVAASVENITDLIRQGHTTRSLFFSKREGPRLSRSMNKTCEGRDVLQGNQQYLFEKKRRLSSRWADTRLESTPASVSMQR
jgi:hypothetical protein